MTPSEARVRVRAEGLPVSDEQMAWGYQGADDHTRILCTNEGDYLLQIGGEDEGRLEFYTETSSFFAAPEDTEWDEY